MPFIRSNVSVRHPSTPNLLSQFFPQIVVADARDDDGLVAELVAVEREVERGAAGDLPAVGVNVPE
jgi:hypothetical protein